MKKLTSIILILTLIFSMEVFAQAAEEIHDINTAEISVEYGPPLVMACDRCFNGMYEVSQNKTLINTLPCPISTNTDTVYYYVTESYYQCISCGYKTNTSTVVNNTNVVCGH